MYKQSTNDDENKRLWVIGLRIKNIFIDLCKGVLGRVLVHFNSFKMQSEVTQTIKQ